MEYVFIAFILALGAVIGSFLNVVIYRYNTGMSLWRGRSMCFSCGKVLHWYELIPIVSFLIQEGACRSCGAPISRQYMAVESITAVLFLASAWKILPLDVFSVSAADIIELFSAWATISLLIVIAVYDLRHKIIPDIPVYAFIVLSGIAAMVFSGGFPPLSLVLAGPALFAPFALLWFFSRGAWMGFGDAKLAWGIGWLLGLSKGISAILIGFWVGAAVGIFLLAREKMLPQGARGAGFGMKSEVPFAPFLVFGALFAFFFDIHIFAPSTIFFV